MPKGVYTAATQGSSAGFVKATVGGVSGTARVRVIEPLPWTFDFENADGGSAAGVVDRRARQGVPAHGRRRRQGAGAAARRHRRPPRESVPRASRT